MSYESTAEPIKLGYLMDFRLPEKYPKEMREDLTLPFELVFNEGLKRRIIDRRVEVVYREVEDLSARHDAIAEVAVIGVADDEFGQRLKVFVVAREGVELSEEDVKSHVKSHLARFKVPRDVEFLDSLPRNATGKVLKRELA